MVRNMVRGVLVRSRGGGEEQERKVKDKRPKAKGRKRGTRRLTENFDRPGDRFSIRYY
jgi:hypothetical protein